MFSLFFLIVVAAYYHVKPASRTLVITYLGSETLPYIWICSAIVLGLLLPLFWWRAARCTPFQIVTSSSFSFALLLLVFNRLLQVPTPEVVVAFYILADVYSVVLVEQFWGLAGTAFQTAGGKRWYGVVGSGGLLGGMAGSACASLLLSRCGFKTLDLLLPAAGLLLLLALVTGVMSLRGARLQPAPQDPAPKTDAPSRQPAPARYAALIMVLLLFAQLVEPIVEYQFMHLLEKSEPHLEARTAYLSSLFMVLSGAALAINLTLTPLILRRLGAVAGLCVQPVLLIAASGFFAAYVTLPLASVLKIADRGLSYSINRASRELLYLPLTAAAIYRIKSWVDMFGYRLFKIVASVIIISLTHWLSAESVMQGLAGLVMLIALLWMAAALATGPSYHALARKAEPPPSAPAPGV